MEQLGGGCARAGAGEDDDQNPTISLPLHDNTRPFALLLLLFPSSLQLRFALLVDMPSRRHATPTAAPTADTSPSGPGRCNMDFRSRPQ
jgi:hypothetical protein